MFYCLVHFTKKKCAIERIDSDDLKSRSYLKGSILKVARELPEGVNDTISYTDNKWKFK